MTGTKLALTIAGVAIGTGLLIKVARAASREGSLARTPWRVVTREAGDGWIWEASRSANVGTDDERSEMTSSNVIDGHAWPTEDAAREAATKYITQVLHQSIGEIS